MAVGTMVARYPRRNSRWFIGEFAVTGGAITAGSIKSKNEFTVIDGGVGLFTIQILENGIAASIRGGRLGPVIVNFIVPPGGATEGGWTWVMNAAESVATNGQFTIRINQQSWAAADPVQTVKVSFMVEGEPA